MINIKKILLDHPSLFELVKSSNNEPNLIKVTIPQESTNQSISFFSNTSHLHLMEQCSSSLWIMTTTLWDKHSTTIDSAATKNGSSVLTTKQLQISMTAILQYFDRRLELLSMPPGISTMTWIHPSALIEKGVSIGPFTTIGPNVQIKSGTSIGPHCTIEGDTSIGNSCYLESHVFVGRSSEVGNHCRIKPFATIGSDGFGYAANESGATKIPQIGKVVLEDYVDIGAGTCIDRATISKTRIGRGTKIDNLVHIAHNCDVGQYCFITAGFAMAGSSTLGDFFMTGGKVAIGDHVNIPSKVTLAGATVVTSNIEKSGSYGGNPALPMQDYLRTRATLANLPQMKKDISKILKHLGLNA